MYFWMMQAFRGYSRFTHDYCNATQTGDSAHCLRTAGAGKDAPRTIRSLGLNHVLLASPCLQRRPRTSTLTLLTRSDYEAVMCQTAWLSITFPGQHPRSLLVASGPATHTAGQPVGQNKLLPSGGSG